MVIDESKSPLVLVDQLHVPRVRKPLFESVCFIHFSICSREYSSKCPRKEEEGMDGVLSPGKDANMNRLQGTQGKQWYMRQLFQVPD